jgi:hypothetical protein
MSTKRIGLLIGREWSWPSALMAEINRRDVGVQAELVELGGVRVGDEIGYDLILDRMSHDVPFYRAFAKYAALQGTIVVNNPFTWSVDDKFFGMTLLERLRMTTPRTVILPNKNVEADSVPETFRNLSYPLDWNGIVDYVGVPAIFKDAITGGRRVVFRVNNVDELIDKYDESHTLTMILQQIVPGDCHVHCLVIGGQHVLPMKYLLDDATYEPAGPEIDKALLDQVQKDALTITRAYGYDINMVEFVVDDGVPYVINPSNPAPDLDINLVGASSFHWSVMHVADFLIAQARASEVPSRGPRWTFAEPDLA